MSLKKAAQALERVGIPSQDFYGLPTSGKRFPDGAWYRMEISGIERSNVLEAMIDEMEKRDIIIHRIIAAVMGSTLLDERELKDFAQMAKDANLEVILTPGPRSAWDTGRQLVTPEGSLSGIRYRGSNQLRYVISDILRCIEIGFRGFLVIDEGLLWVLNQMRENGDIPANVIFKVSIYTGHGSPAGGKLLESLGADTFNPLCDLSLPQFASIRHAVDIPLDVHIIITESFGGSIRFYEAPEMTRTLAPCYYKIEPGPACAIGPQALYKPWTDRKMLADWAREKVKYAQIVHELIQKNYPRATMSPSEVEDLAVPRP